MFSKIPKLSLRAKIVIILAGYVVFSELIKIGAEIYALEHSLDLKLALFWLVMIVAYKIPDIVTVAILVFLLLLSPFGISVGISIYVFILYTFSKLLLTAIKIANE